MFQASDMILYFNIVCGITLLMSILYGFINGFLKTSFMTIFFLIVLVIGVISIPFISELLLDVNMKFINLILPNEITTEFTSVRASAPAILTEMFPERASMFVEGTESLLLVFGIIKMAINIVLFILLLVLNFTVFKFIGWILWMFVKPKNNPNTGDKPKKHRLLGAGVGVVRGLILLLLLAIPMAGFSSLATSANKIMRITESNTNGEVQQASEMDEFEEYLSFLIDYRQTYIGQVFKSVDTPMFDAIIKVNTKVSDKDISLKLRSDIEHMVSIYEILVEANNGSSDFDENLFFKLTDDQITEIADYLSKADFIKVGVSIGAEILYDYLVNEDLINGYEDKLTLENLKNLQVSEDIKTLAEVIILTRAVEFEGEFKDNVFTLTEEEVSEIISKLSELKLLEYALPIGLNFFFNLESTQQLMIENGLDVTDLVKPIPEELLIDFENLANVYKAVKDLGYSSVDELKALENTENLKLITDVQTTNLVSSIFGFNVLTDNSRLISTVLYDMLINGLPESYQSVITVEAFQNNFNETEVTNLVLLTKLFLEVGMFEENFNEQDLLTTENIEKLSTRISGSTLISGIAKDLILTMASSFNLPITIEVPESVTFGGDEGKAEIQAVLTSVKAVLEANLLDDSFNALDLTDQDIQDLATSISESKIMTHNIPLMLDQMLGNMTTITLEIPEDFSFEGESGKEELVALLTNFRTFSEKGFLESSFNIQTLTDADIRSIAKDISSSVIMTHNIPSFLDYVSAGTSFEFLSDVDVEVIWDENELYYTLNAAKIFMTNNITQTNINSLTNEQIHQISLSKYVSNVIGLTINSMNEPGETLDGKLFIPTIDTWYSTDSSTGELEYLFLGLKEMVGLNDLSSFNVTADELLDKDIDLIIRSKTLEATIIEKHIKPLYGVGGSLENKLDVPSNVEWYQTETKAGELKPFFEGIDLLIGNSTIAAFTPSVDSILNLDHETIFKSVVLEHTMVNNHIKPLIISGSLQPFINEKKLDGSDYQWLIDRTILNGSSDSLEFLAAIIDLNTIGINYNNLTYNGFVALFADETKPKQTNDILVKSEIFAHSFGKMFGNLLTPTLNISVKQDKDSSYWGSTTADGELLYMLEGLFKANDLKNFNYGAVTSTTVTNDKLIITDIVEHLYDSDTLRQLLIDFPNSSLMVANSYRRVPGDPGYVAPEDLTKAQWINETSVIFDILVEVNEGFSFSNPYDPAQVVRLMHIKAAMDLSVLYDSSKFLS